MAGSARIVHPFEPVFDAESRILILGSLPSEKSREGGFYYGHPQNRFWKVLARIFGEDISEPPATDESIRRKRDFLLRRKIALWDVIRSCDIRASSDSSIRNAEPNDIEMILSSARIQKVLANGAAAFSLCKKFFGGRLEEEFGAETVKLPSTSPANAAWTLERLAEAWKREMAGAALL